MTVANPPWSFNLNFAKGDIPSGYYPTLYDHTGTLIPNQQFDQSRAWSDGSMRRATFSMISPDTFAGNGTSGDTFSYSVHKTAGSPSTTPLVTLADVQAQDIKLVFSGFDCGSDSFQLRLNDLLAAANNVIRPASQPYASYVGTLTATSGATSGSTSIGFAGLTATVTDDPCNASFTASISTSGVMTVTAVASGFIHVGATVSGTGIQAGTTITAPIGGTGGYTGSYQLSWSPSSAIASETVTSSYAGSSLPFQVSIGMQAYTGSAPNGAYVTAISGNTITLSTPGLDATNSTIKFGYPVWQYDQIKYGPVCSEWKFRGLLRRVSDGAWHRWVYACIFLKAWGTAGSWEFNIKVENPNCYGAHPTGSVGASANPAPRFAAPAVLYNGATVLANYGGASDWTAFTLSASGLPAASGFINLSTYPVDSTGLRSFYWTGWAFSTAGGGTLPTGISANTVYWPVQLTNGVALSTQRWFAVDFLYGGGPFTQWSSGVSVGAGSYYQTSDSTIWYVQTGGTTGSTAPSGTGTVTTPDGIVWIQATQVISGGSGTITMYQVPAAFPSSAWIGKDQYGSAIWWQGSGTLTARPKLMLQPDFTYLTTKTTAVPPLNPSIATSPNNPGATVPLPDGLTFDYDRGGGINYYHSYQPNNAPPWTYPQNESQVGDDPGDERVGPIPGQSAWLLAQPGSTILSQLVRCLGYFQIDLPNNVINEQSGYPIAANEGPGRVQSVGGSNYAGLGNTDPTFSGVGSAVWKTLNTLPPYGMPTLNQYGVVQETLHCQQEAWIPYLLDGDMLDWETNLAITQGLMLANTQNMPNTYNFPHFTLNMGGCVGALNGNSRGMAWAMRAIGNVEFGVPAAHPLFNYIRDCLDDSAALYPAFYADTANLDGGANQAAQGITNAFAGPPGQLSIEAVGYSVLATGVGFQMAMQWFIWAWQAWRESFEGRRPAFNNFLTGYLSPQINILNGDYITGGSEIWAGPHVWCPQDLNDNYFASTTDTIHALSAPGLYNNLSSVTTNIANNDARFLIDSAICAKATAAAAAGTNQLSYTVVFAYVSVAVGWTVYDVTNPSAIPADTYVTAVSGNTVTLSANITSPGVAANDYINFLANTTATAAVSAGSTTITLSHIPQGVASPVLIGNNDSMAIPMGTTIASTSGNTVTLSNAIVSPGVTQGETVWLKGWAGLYGDSTTINVPPGDYAWDTNSYPTMALAAFAMLSWAAFPGAQNVYNRLKTRINTAPLQGITWAQTNNSHYDSGHPAAYLPWNYISASGS